MSTLKSFSCPTCAAPISITSDTFEVRCDFCGNMVVVPPEFRPKPFEPTPPPQANFSPQTSYSGGMPGIYRPRPTSFWSIAPAILIVGAVIVGIIYYFVAQSALESRVSRPPATQIVVAAQITRAPNTAEALRATSTPAVPTVPTVAVLATVMALADQADQCGPEHQHSGSSDFDRRAGHGPV